MTRWVWIMTEIDLVLQEEGFRAKPYPDPIKGWAVPTFGHGLTYITEEESRKIVAQRMYNNRVRAIKMLQVAHVDPDKLDRAADIIAHMAYQLGFGGVSGFPAMWAAIGKGDFKTAAAEMRDSLWYRQTPARAERLAQRMEQL